MNIDELKMRLVNEWAQLDQSIIDSQWRRRLSACVRARGAHFEHKFWQFWTQVLWELIVLLNKAPFVYCALIKSLKVYCR